jgi:hypothetical protein
MNEEKGNNPNQLRATSSAPRTAVSLLCVHMHIPFRLVFNHSPLEPVEKKMCI